MDKVLTVLLGPSCSGKTTVARQLQELGFVELVSHTTRDKRKGEVDGEDYYFLSEKEMDNLEKLEYVEYAGNRYSLSKKEFEKKSSLSEKLMVIMERNGIEQMLQTDVKDNIMVVFFTASDEVIKDRMLKRDGNLKRYEHSIKTGEFENQDIADLMVETDGLSPENIAFFINKAVETKLRTEVKI